MQVGLIVLSTTHQLPVWICSNPKDIGPDVMTDVGPGFRDVLCRYTISS